MIVLLKMRTAGKILGKICLKAIKVNLFFQYLVHDQGKERDMNERVGNPCPQPLVGNPAWESIVKEVTCYNIRNLPERYPTIIVLKRF